MADSRKSTVISIKRVGCHPRGASVITNSTSFSKEDEIFTRFSGPKVSHSQQLQMGRTCDRLREVLGENHVDCAAEITVVQIRSPDERNAEGRSPEGGCQACDFVADQGPGAARHANVPE
ncbi:hypothetical protein Bbelb_445580 [Branchiostoma belcheri]|nr:hypothetical protein Bbelb_445580 [Branchiostoma belcheri]